MEMSSIEPLVLIRMLCGIWFIPHCIGKLMHIDKACVTFEKAGFRPPKPFIILTFLLELVAGTGLIFGIYEKVAAAIVVVIMLGASYAMLKINGFNWRWQKLGPEYMIFWSIVCVLSVSG